MIILTHDPYITAWGMAVVHHETGNILRTWYTKTAPEQKYQ